MREANHDEDGSENKPPKEYPMSINPEPESFQLSQAVLDLPTTVTQAQRCFPALPGWTELRLSDMNPRKQVQLPRAGTSPRGRRLGAELQCA